MKKIIKKVILSIKMRMLEKEFKRITKGIIRRKYFTAADLRIGKQLVSEYTKLRKEMRGY